MQTALLVIQVLATIGGLLSFAKFVLVGAVDLMDLVADRRARRAAIVSFPRRRRA